MSEYSKKRRAEDDNESKKRKVESELSEDEYEVEAIEDHQVVDGKYYYCVKWKGYDEITWEPSQNLDNCNEKLKEYKLAVKLKNKASSATKGTKINANDQRIVSLKNARSINYKKFYGSNSREDNKTSLKDDIDPSDGISSYSKNDAMPLEVRLPPFGPGDQSIIFKNRTSNKPKDLIVRSPSKPKWCGIMYRKKDGEERRVGAIQVTNYIDNSMENFPYFGNQNQSRLVINHYMEFNNSVLDNLIKDSLNSVDESNKFPIYVATFTNSSSEDLTELDKLQSYLSKKFKVGVINTEKWTLYLLPTSTKEFSDILYIDKPKNVNDLYFILQFPKNEISSNLRLQPPLSKKRKSPTEQVKSNMRSSSSPITPTSSTPTNFNQSRKIFDQTKKHKDPVVKARHYETTQQNNILPNIPSLSNPTPTSLNSNKEISNNFELQPPPAKKHRRSDDDLLGDDKTQQNNILPKTQFSSSLAPVQASNSNEKVFDNLNKLYLQSKKRKGSVEEVQHLLQATTLSHPVQTVVEDEPSKLSVNFRSGLENYFETAKFTVVGSKYTESQRVINFLKEIGSTEVVVNDSRVNCILIHQNEIIQGVSFENLLSCKRGQKKFFLISKENTTITLQEIFVSGGVILATSGAIKNTDNLIDDILYLTNLVNGWNFKIHPNILSYLERLMTFLSDNESLRAKLHKAFNGIVDGLISGQIKYLLPNEMPLDNYNMDSRKLTFDSMECLSKINYNEYRHFIVIDDTDESDEQSVESEMKGIETMSIKKFKQKFHELM